MIVEKREKYFLSGPKLIFEGPFNSTAVIIIAMVKSEYLRKLQKEKLHNFVSWTIIISDENEDDDDVGYIGSTGLKHLSRKI
jgi:hypothetical protein